MAVSVPVVPILVSYRPVLSVDKVLFSLSAALDARVCASS